MMNKPFIVKLNERDEYFRVEYYLTTIINITFTKSKKKATVFQDGGDEIIAPNGKDKISLNKVRLTQFSLFLYLQGVTKDEITSEEVQSLPDPLFSKSQIKQNDKFIATLKKSICKEKQ